MSIFPSSPFIFKQLLFSQVLNKQVGIYNTFGIFQKSFSQFLSSIPGRNHSNSNIIFSKRGISCNIYQWPQVSILEPKQFYSERNIGFSFFDLRFRRKVFLLTCTCTYILGNLEFLIHFSVAKATLQSHMCVSQSVTKKAFNFQPSTFFFQLLSFFSLFNT